MTIASDALETTDARLMCLNMDGSVVWGTFATGVTMAQRQSPGICEVWRERVEMRERVGAM